MQETQEAPSQDRSYLADLGRQAVGAMYKGAGSAVRGAGKAAQIVGDHVTTPIANAITGRDDRTPNMLEGTANSLRDYGDSIQRGVSDQTRDAMRDSTPSGDLTKPDTWSMGDDPSMEGYLALGIDMLGQQFPVLLAAAASAPLAAGGRIAATAAAGGSQGGGAAVEQIDQMIDEMDQSGTLEKESSVYRSLRESGLAHADAVTELKEATGQMAFMLTAPFSAIGGALTGKIANPAERMLAGRGAVSRVAGRAALGGVEEGAQEAVEGIQTNRGVNAGAGMDLDVTRDSFGDAVMGALAGAKMGAAAGAIERHAERTSVAPTLHENPLPASSMTAEPAASESILPADVPMARGAVDEAVPQLAAVDPAVATSAIDVDALAHQAAESPNNDRTPPTEAQKAAGNYKKGHVSVAGLDISVENPEGSERRGRDADGREWTNKMAGHYGYIRGTKGNDGDQIDVYLRPGTGSSFEGSVFVIDQVDPKTGAHDEHKVMLGYASEKDARDAYQASYGNDWNGMSAITEMSMPDFKRWTKEGDPSKPVAAPQSDIVGRAGKPFLTRSAAQRAADSHGNAAVVETEDGRFVVRPNQKAVAAPLSNVDVEGSLDIGTSPVESRSAMKSVDANVRRGRDSMNRALTEKRDVKRAMHRSDLGWIDFVWGDPKRGIQHIIERRMSQDGLSRAAVTKLLTEDIVDTIASGETVRRNDYGKATRLVLQKSGREAVLTRNNSTNGWLLTGFIMREEAGDSAAGYVASRPTLDAPTRYRGKEGAAPKKSIGGEARQINIAKSKRLSVADAQRAAGEFMKKLPGAAKLSVKVVQSVSDIPEGMRPSSMAEGVYYPAAEGGRIYLVADNLPSPERQQQVLAHEVIGHFGVEALLGDRFPALLADVRRLARAPEGARIPRDLGPKHPLYATMEAVYLSYPDYSAANRAREVLARMAETNRRPFLLERVYGQIRTALRAMGFSIKLTNADLRQMVIDAGKFLRHAAPDRAQKGMLEAAASLAANSRKVQARNQLAMSVDERMRRAQ